MTTDEIVATAFLAITVIWTVANIVIAGVAYRKDVKQEKFDELVQLSKEHDLPWAEHNDISVADSMATYWADYLKAEDGYYGR